MQKEARWRPNESLVSLPIEERVKVVRQRQHDVLRPMLENNYPKLYTGNNSEAQELAEIVVDYELKKKEVKTRAVEIQKETVLDQFIKDFILNPANLERLPFLAEDVRLNTNISEETIKKLLKEAATYIAKLNSPEKAKFFAYKKTDDNLTSKQDAEVLRGIVTYAIDIPNNESLQTETNKVCRQMRDFYWRNIDQLFSREEDTPRLAFFYDYLLTACYSENTESFRQIAQWIIEIIKATKQYYPELQKAKVKKEKEQEIVIRSVIKKYHPIKDIDVMIKLADPEDDLIINLVGRKDRKSTIGKYFDRIIGIGCIEPIFPQWNLKFLEACRKFNIRTFGLDIASYQNWSAKIGEYLNINCLYEQLNAYTSPELINTQVTSLEPFFNKFSSLIGKTDLSNKKNNLLKTIEFNEKDSIGAKENRVSSLIELSFGNSGAEKLEFEKEQVMKNHELVFAISNKNKWFVATNGDEFNIRDNPDLAEFDLESVIFRPVNFGKAGHSVEFVTKHKDKSGQLYKFIVLIGRDGEISYSNGINVVLPKWLEVKMKNFILTRLNYITIAAQANEQAEKKLEDGDKESETEITARRAHFRYLTSTPKRHYDLASFEVNEHAQFVLRRYGINIRDENLKRWAARTLRRDQVCTFVREVDKGNAPPNKIKFDEVRLRKKMEERENDK